MMIVEMAEQDKEVWGLNEANGQRFQVLYASLNLESLELPLGI
jgi:hypothetical protein